MMETKEYHFVRHLFDESGAVETERATVSVLIDPDDPETDQARAYAVLFHTYPQWAKGEPVIAGRGWSSALTDNQKSDDRQRAENLLAGNSKGLHVCQKIEDEIGSILYYRPDCESYRTDICKLLSVTETHVTYAVPIADVRGSRWLELTPTRRSAIEPRFIGALCIAP